ncbi:hypothetical protein BS78_09G077900 [Paspalum vaginatum]|nr:hypothetical protein BS78_09G077900 [Paspalum vaginatum]
MSLLGDPATRPEEGECYIPASYAIDASLREWESTAAISWALGAPASTGAKEIEAAFRDEFRLHHGEVSITKHHPEQPLGATRYQQETFLIKFLHRHHSDGVPRHAWDAEIGDRLISRRRALERIDTDLLHPAETKIINLWAWTANPSSIPKRIWPTFTSRTKDARLSSVLISETPPEHWQQGRKNPVLVHLEEVHDYTMATVDNRGAFSPAKRRLPQWTLGVPDGEPAPARAAETFLCREQDARERNSNQQRHRNDKESQDRRGRYNDDHPDFLHGRGGHRHDDEDDDERRGRDGQDVYGRRGHVNNGSGVYRERERSPRRRDWCHSNRREGRQRAEMNTMDGNALQAIFKLQATALQDAAQRLLDAVGEEHAGKSGATPCGLLIDYIGKACELAAKLGLPEAPPVPGHEAFSGNKGGQNVQTATPIAVKQASIAAVEQALSRIELAAEVGAPDCGLRPVSPFALSQGMMNQNALALMMHEQIGLEEDVVMEEAEILGHVPSVAALFAAPSPPLLNNQQCLVIDTTGDTPPPALAPERRRRPRRGFNMSKVRRSARLDAAPRLNVMQKAQRNLCRKLGLLNDDDLQTIEAALQDFVAMFDGPLPQHVIAALTSLFNLDNDDAEKIDQALAGLVDEGVAELQDAVQEMLTEAGEAAVPAVAA